MKLYYNAAKKDKKPIPSETGARLKYDIEELRIRPEKLTKGWQEYEKGKETKELQEGQHCRGEWNSYNERIGGR